MKKNLRNVLVLALGLTTTIASAQWSAESRTRISNESADTRTGDQRITVGTDLGGIHASYDINYAIDGSGATHDVYEAYASTDFLGFGTLTAGRKDLSYGSGALMSSNSWGSTRYTNDGIALGLDLGGLAIDVGTMGGVRNDLGNYMNASGTFGGANVNVLMMNNADGQSAHGYDLSYSMGDFALSASMNSDYNDQEMTSYGIEYSGIDNLTISMSRTTYGDAAVIDDGSTLVAAVAGVNTGDTTGWTAAVVGVDPVITWGTDAYGAPIITNIDSSGYVAAADAFYTIVGDSIEASGTPYSDHGGFWMDNTAMSGGNGGWDNGVLGYQGANDEVTSIGISYDLGDISLGYTMHTISNDTDADGDGTADAEDRDANELSFTYNLSDNSSFSIARFTDGDNEYNWLTLTIGM